MGLEIDRDEFDEPEFERFADRLDDCLRALRALLARPGFGQGPTTIGAELEMFLVDADGLPLPRNTEVLAGTPPAARVTLEIDRFNLEVNPDPTAIAGRPFAAIGERIRSSLAEVASAAEAHGGRIALIGILPTLRLEDLTRAAITDTPRYRALNNRLARLRQEPIQITLHGPGDERVEVVRDDVAFEGANTSFQVHVRTDPARFTHAYNAAQLATAPALAVAANSPVFLGAHLWEETRVALFEQVADDRDDAGRNRRVPRVAFGTGWLHEDPVEPFQESVRLHEPLLPVLAEQDPMRIVDGGGVPALDELRLHQGTVWRWNRAIYDHAAGGHVRVELRALPSGPTVTDMLANAAFLTGLTLALTDQAPRLTRQLTFARANANFYRAARHGPDARLEWPGADGPERAADLARRLLPVAAQGLEAAGVDGAEVGELLGVLEARIDGGHTGAAWQRRTLTRLEPELGRQGALRAMLERYLAHSATGEPVHTWDD